MKINSTLLHTDLIFIQKFIFDPLHFEYSVPEVEAESAEYAAHSFLLKALNVRFRVSKITPTKTGQFVTLWKRNKNGPIQPFDESDPVDLVIISARKENNFGQFMFPKSVLCERAIFSNNGKEGKRAIRVYPPWDEANSVQAASTQKWQLDYFLDLSDSKTIDLIRAEKLLF
jgi:hypothetical protein